MYFLILYIDYYKVNSSTLGWSEIKEVSWNGQSGGHGTEGSWQCCHGQVCFLIYLEFKRKGNKIKIPLYFKLICFLAAKLSYKFNTESLSLSP